MTLDPQLQALVDVEAIRDLARDYAHWVWKGDAERAVDLFLDEGVMDMGDRDPLVGRDAMLASYRATFEASSFRPMVHQHVVTLAGDTATGTCYLDLKCSVEGVAMQGYGYYDDEYERTEAGWKFRKRALNMLRYVPDRDGGEGA